MTEFSPGHVEILQPNSCILTELGKLAWVTAERSGKNVAGADTRRRMGAAMRPRGGDGALEVRDLRRVTSISMLTCGARVFFACHGYESGTGSLFCRDHRQVRLADNLRGRLDAPSADAVRVTGLADLTKIANYGSARLGKPALPSLAPACLRVTAVVKRLKYAAAEQMSTQTKASATGRPRKTGGIFGIPSTGIPAKKRLRFRPLGVELIFPEGERVLKHHFKGDGRL